MLGEIQQEQGDFDLDWIEDDDPLVLQQTFMVQEDRRQCEYQQSINPIMSQETTAPEKSSVEKKVKQKVVEDPEKEAIEQHSQ